MFKLRIGYLIGGITTGLILLLGFFWSLPDGKLHIVVCNVGQGDATYVRFPDGVWSRPRRLTERVSRRMDWYSACGEIRALQGLGFGLSTDARKLLDGRA